MEDHADTAPLVNEGDAAHETNVGRRSFRVIVGSAATGLGFVVAFILVVLTMNLFSNTEISSKPKEHHHLQRNIVIDRRPAADQTGPVSLDGIYNYGGSTAPLGGLYIAQIARDAAGEFGFRTELRKNRLHVLSMQDEALWKTPANAMAEADIILAVQGIPVFDSNDIRRIFDEQDHGGRALNVTLFRGTVEDTCGACCSDSGVAIFSAGTCQEAAVSLKFMKDGKMVTQGSLLELQGEGCTYVLGSQWEAWRRKLRRRRLQEESQVLCASCEEAAPAYSFCEKGIRQAQAAGFFSADADWSELQASAHHAALWSCPLACTGSQGRSPKFYINGQLGTTSTRTTSTRTTSTRTTTTMTGTTSTSTVTQTSTSTVTSSTSTRTGTTATTTTMTTTTVTTTSVTVTTTTITTTSSTVTTSTRTTTSSTVTQTTTTTTSFTTSSTSTSTSSSSTITTSTSTTVSSTTTSSSSSTRTQTTTTTSSSTTSSSSTRTTTSSTTTHTTTSTTSTYANISRSAILKSALGQIYANIEVISPIWATPRLNALMLAASQPIRLFPEEDEPVADAVNSVGMTLGTLRLLGQFTTQDTFNLYRNDLFIQTAQDTDQEPVAPLTRNKCVCKPKTASSRDIVGCGASAGWCCSRLDTGRRLDGLFDVNMGMTSWMVSTPDEDWRSGPMDPSESALVGSRICETEPGCLNRQWDFCTPAAWNNRAVLWFEPGVQR